MTGVFIQADDFSGAAEVGHCFAAHGLGVRLLLSGAPAAGQPERHQGVSPAGGTQDVTVVDTHTRAVAPEVAATALSATFVSPGAARARILFKKIDSLWRGNVGPELAAIAGLSSHVVLAGALPHLRRTVVDGKPLVDGVPLDRADLWSAETTEPPSSIPQLLLRSGVAAAQTADLDAVRSGALADRFLELLSTETPTIVVVDGETQGDLEAVVEALQAMDFTAGHRRIVLAGTGGLADVLASTLLPPAAHNAQDREPSKPVTVAATVAAEARPVLAVVGSASATARSQLRQLAAAGFRTAAVNPSAVASPEWEAGWDAEWDAERRLLRDSLKAGLPLALTPAATEVDPTAAGTIVRHLAETAAGLLQSVRPAADLILTGGETAREVLDALGIDVLTPLAAVQHGAVVSLADDGRLVGTKPGSFGDEHALRQLYESIITLRAGVTVHPGPTAKPQDHPSENTGAPMNSAVSSTTGQDTRPFIAVTMGDGAGVGPEVTVGALLAENAYRDCRPVVIGDTYRLRLGAEALGADANIVEINNISEAVFEPGRINVIDPKLLPADLPWGQESAEAGNAAYHYIRIACELGMSGQVQGICTAPLNKAALHKAGHIYPGHTELLAHFMGVEEVSMMLSTPKVKVIHVTTHIGLIDAIRKIEPGLVERTVRRGHSAMQRAGIDNPKIGVCAINPHAGENGLFGYGEEAEKITPAIEKLQADGIDARGPLPADTAFFLAGRGDYDLIVAMYHDQGHGPVKVLGIEAGVNITVGLPVIRTSVDHGTAFDIAGKGIVEVGSMIEALRQAAEMSPSPVSPSA